MKVAYFEVIKQYNNKLLVFLNLTRYYVSIHVLGSVLLAYHFLIPASITAPGPQYAFRKCLSNQQNTG